MDHEKIEGLIPAYALGAADPDESEAVEAHLPSCAECRAALADFRGLGEDLLYSAPAMAAPADLTERMRRRLAASRPEQKPAPWWARLRLGTLAPVLGALVLLLAITNFYWIGRVNRLQHQATEQSAFLARLADAPALPLTADATAPYAQGVLYRPADSPVALLCVYGMPVLPKDKTYQVWLIKDSQRDNGGLFRVTQDGFGLLVLRPDRPLSEYTAVGITAEPAGGSPAPTSPRLLGAGLEQL
jgi:anti-sigma-K factor RskA